MKKILTLFAVAMLVFSSCCSPKAEKKEIGIQLYSIRDLIGSEELYAQNHEQVFKALADMGYTSMELWAYSDGKFFGRTPEEFKADLDAAGLKALSTHTVINLSAEELASKDFSAKLDWWKTCIADHKAIGCKYIVAPSFNIPDNLEDLKTNCEYFNEIGKLCAEQGLKFGYHNHSREFRKIEDTLVYDYMIENTDPELVFFEMDVYWTMMAQKAPVEYFKKYPGRFTALHIKDWREVGQSGMVGFDAIFNNADIAGMKDYFVEMEGSSLGDIMKTCEVSANYLLNAPFVKKSYND